MSDLNRVCVVGRLTRDPEVKHTSGGQTLCKFSLANGRKYTSNGERREETSFFDCTIWGKGAEIFAQYTRKGSQVAVDGRLSQRTWEDSEGKKRSAVEIVVNDFQFLGGKKAEGAPVGAGEYPDDEIPEPF